MKMQELEMLGLSLSAVAKRGTHWCSPEKRQSRMAWTWSELVLVELAQFKEAGQHPLTDWNKTALRRMIRA